VVAPSKWPFCYAAPSEAGWWPARLWCPADLLTSADVRTCHLQHLASEPPPGVFSSPTFFAGAFRAHFGGMSDHVQPTEHRQQVSRHLFTALSEYQYPDGHYTRNTRCTGTYGVAGQNEQVVVQVLVQPHRPKVPRAFEPHSPRRPDFAGDDTLIERLHSPVVRPVSALLSPGTCERPPRICQTCTVTERGTSALGTLKVPLERAARVGNR